MVDNYTNFKGVTHIGNTMLLDELENNLKSFLDWSLLNIGGFINVVRPHTSTIDSGRMDVMRPSTDPSYTAGTVWETIRKDWVWETGVNLGGHIPIAISGIYINGQFFQPGDATYGHHYDYPNGRVIFNSPLSTSSGVTINYSYRLIQVYKSNEADWFFESQYNSARPANDQWDMYSPSSGDYSIPPQKRAQFPAIIIETIPRGFNDPWELGNLSLLVHQDVMFNIVAETRSQRNRLVDILRFEDNHTIALYDTDEVVSSGLYPLDYRGMLVNLTGMYPYLVDNHRLTTCYFSKVTFAEVESLSPQLHEGKVRATIELILNGV